MQNSSPMKNKAISTFISKASKLTKLPLEAVSAILNECACVSCPSASWDILGSYEGTEADQRRAKLRESIKADDDRFLKEGLENDGLLSDEEYGRRERERQQKERQLSSIVDGGIGAALAGITLRCFCRVRHRDVYSSSEPDQAIVFCADQDNAEQEIADFAQDEKAQYQQPHQQGPQLNGTKSYPALIPAGR